jgi:surfactin synthase thioesterase subunit
MRSTPWLVRQRGGQRRLRLYCFSYAGGNAFCFLPWQTHLKPEIEVCGIQFPGRGERLTEPLYSSFPMLIKVLAQVIAEDNTLPFAFFGHSLGGLVAFELARYCRRHDLCMPVHLFASGCAAPQSRGPDRRLHEFDEDRLINALKEYNGTPLGVLEDRELLGLILPAIRADFALMADYRYHPGPRLDIPITVLVGKHDDQICLEQIDCWQNETTNRCHVQWFEGGHFFINEEQPIVLTFLKRALSDACKTFAG